MVFSNQSIAGVLRHIAMAAAGIAEILDPSQKRKTR